MCSFKEETNDAELRATEIVMDSSLSILLEGDCDELLYSKFLDGDYCKIEVMNGKENVVEVMGLINQKKPTAAIAIIDADLDYIQNVKYPPNIFLTDSHDADTEMFLSEAFYRVAREFYSKNKVYTIDELKYIQDKIIEIEIPMACMRIYDKEKQLNFAFKPNSDDDKGFPFGKFIEIDKNKLGHKGVKTMVKIACSYNGDQGRGMNHDEIADGVKEVIKREYPVALIIHGHDLMHLLSLSLKRYGKKNKQNRTNEDWESCFRLAYSKVEFENTRLYGKLKSYSIDSQIPFLL